MRINSLLAILAVAITARGAQITIVPDICQDANCFVTGASYSGSNIGNAFAQGAVLDSIDAFDLYGIYAGPAFPLSLTRRTTLLSNNTYRFFDTFTNTTSQASSPHANRFEGNLGSDSGTVLDNNSGFVWTTYEDIDFNGIPDGDPVVAHVRGNNAFALTTNRSMSSIDGYNVTFTLPSLAPGQSVSLVFYAVLALDTGDRAGDRALALSVANGLVANPDFSGLNQQEISRILNFTPGTGSPVPEPAAVWLAAAGVVLLGAVHKQKS